MSAPHSGAALVEALEGLAAREMAPDLHVTATVCAGALVGILVQLEHRVQLQREAALRAEKFNTEAMEMLKSLTLELTGPKGTWKGIVE